LGTALGDSEGCSVGAKLGVAVGMSVGNAIEAWNRVGSAVDIIERTAEGSSHLALQSECLSAAPLKHHLE